MPGPFAGYLDPLDMFSQGATGGLLQRATTQLWLPIDQYLAAQASVNSYIKQQQAWYANPCVLPSPDVLFELDIKGYFPDSNIIHNSLRQHGITEGMWGPDEYTKVIERRKLWNAVASLKLRVPDPMMIVDAWRRGFLTDEDDARDRMRRAGGSWEALMKMEPMLRERPSVGMILAARFQNRPNTHRWAEMMKAAGSDASLWEEALSWLVRPPSIGEALQMMNRGVADDNDLLRWLDWHGLKDDGMFGRYKEMQKGIPGVADLNMFGVRHAWQPELVERYGYYREFPKLLRPWYAKLGLNYDIGFMAVTDEGLSSLKLADAYWASHWHVLPLGSAFQAYQRFQPDLVHRFQEDNPKLTPFTREDLEVHMRQADFPPGVREWLTALAHPVLGTRVIQQAVQYLGWDQAEVQARYRLLGYTPTDAAVMARMAERRQVAREQAWLKTIESRAHQQTVRMIEGLYTDGTIDRPFAMRQLSDAGLSDVLSTQLLDIADFGVERSLVRAAVSATSRDYLSGVLSRAQAETQLRRIGITDYRIGNYLAAWGIQRSARRKRFETAKVAGMVTAGLMSPEEARARLANLQWSDPDATLLLAEAEGKLAKRLAAEQKSAETSARQRAKELERLAKDAEAQSKKLRAEANRIAPRSAVTAWLRDGIIDDDTFRNMLRERGYNDESIERYLKDAKQPKPRPPRPSPTTPPWPKPAGSAHPAQARLAKWLKDGIITIEDYADGLADLGYSDSDVARFVEDASPAVNGQA